MQILVLPVGIYDVWSPSLMLYRELQIGLVAAFYWYCVVAVPPRVVAVVHKLTCRLSSPGSNINFLGHRKKYVFFNFWLNGSDKF